MDDAVFAAFLVLQETLAVILVFCCLGPDIVGLGFMVQHGGGALQGRLVLSDLQDCLRLGKHWLATGVIYVGIKLLKVVLLAAKWF